MHPIEALRHQKKLPTENHMGGHILRSATPDKIILDHEFSRRGEVREWLKRAASKAGGKLQR